MIELRLIKSFPPYLSSAMVRFPFEFKILFGEIVLFVKIKGLFVKKKKVFCEKSFFGEKRFLVTTVTTVTNVNTVTTVTTVTTATTVTTVSHVGRKVCFIYHLTL